MSDKRQNNQLQMALAFTGEGRSEAPRARRGGTESLTAERRAESPATEEQRMEAVCERENCLRALKRVKANQGSAGIDGMTVEELPGYLAQHWPAIREQLLSGSYRPQPVRRVEIPKPDGGMRKLGIPMVLDRFIQQAVMQILQAQWDATFSRHSYGFRPQRSAHQAVAQAQQYVREGYGWVVDLDLEKFFDRVNHDRLMSAVARRIGDKRMLKLIRGFLEAGVMEGGLVSPVDEGTPQGGPLSPLLSNLVLDELGRELERRGHRFVRYADDCNIYVRSERAGQRVMTSITGFITRRLKLKVNAAKSDGGATVATEVSGLQHDVAAEAEAEDCATEPRAFCGEHPQEVAPRARTKSETIDRTAQPRGKGMDGILPAHRSEGGTGRTRWLAPTPTAGAAVTAMETQSYTGQTSDAGRAGRATGEARGGPQARPIRSLGSTALGLVSPLDTQRRFSSVS